jgi:DNA ligase (NAD+)
MSVFLYLFIILRVYEKDDILKEYIKIKLVNNIKIMSRIKKQISIVLADPKKYANETSVNKLEQFLRVLSEAYYNTGVSLVPDAIFDLLKNILTNRDPKNKFLTEIGAKISKDKVELPHWMGSLNKIKADVKALDLWKSKFKGPFILSDKLDGVSCLLHKGKKKVKLFTRGDGLYGQNITHLLPYILSDKVKLSKLEENTAIRGELIMTKKNFDKYSKNTANARNLVAGLVNSKTYSIPVAEDTDFVAYSLIHPEKAKDKQLTKLKKWGFEVVHNQEIDTTKKLTNDFLSDLLIKRRKVCKYEIDGMVVSDNSKYYSLTSGKNPKDSFAFKTILTDQYAEVTIVDVIWSPSIDGYIIPKVEVEPVTLVGVTITYAAAHNAKYVVDNVLGPGAVIKLIRSGDVIPYILEVLKPAPTGKPKLPTIKYKWSKTKVNFIATDFSQIENEIIIKQFVHFFKTMKVKYISEGIIKKFVENGYKRLEDLISADKKKLEDIDGVGDKIVDKIFENIQNSFKTSSLVQFMAASHSFGRGFGVRKITPIIEDIPDLLTKKRTSKELKEEVLDIDGFSDITASQFVDNMDKFLAFKKRIAKAIDLSSIEKSTNKKNKSDKFKGQKIVFTGFRDDDLEQYIKDNGGSVTSTVTGNTTLVIYVPTNKESSKISKAKELKIQIKTKDEFIKEKNQKKVSKKKVSKKVSKKKSKKFKNQTIAFAKLKDNVLKDYIEERGGKVTYSISKDVTLVVYKNIKKKLMELEKAKKLNIPFVEVSDFKKKFSKLK